MTGIRDNNDLTTGSVWKKLVLFFFPIYLGLLFQQLYNTVDAIVVGRFVGSSALAAVGGSSAVIIETIIGFFTGLNTGATVVVSQKFGGRDEKGLSRALHTSMVFCVIIGAVITLLGIVFADDCLRLLGNPEDIMEESTRYLRIYFLGSIPTLVYNLCQGSLQAVGDSRRPLIYLAISCSVNICLDLFFVAVLGWGVAGVGWASVISMTVCMLMALVHLFRGKGPCRLEWKKFRLEKNVLRSILPIGIPAGFQSSMYMISNLIIQASINGFGTLVVSSWTATSKLDGFYWVMTNSFSLAICAFAGQCCGAGKIRRMRQAVYTCAGISIVCTLCMSALLMAIARPAYSFFLDTPEGVNYSLEIMSYFVPYYFTWSFVDVLSGTFRGAGDTLKPMLMTMLFTCVFRIIWMLAVVPHWHTLMGVSIVYVISWVLTGLSFIIYYFKGKWLRFSEAPPEVPD